MFLIMNLAVGLELVHKLRRIEDKHHLDLYEDILWTRIYIASIV